MKIGIDARLIGETGVGRYIRNLIEELGHVDETNQYVVFLRRRQMNSFVPPNERWRAYEADIPWHSVTEQFVMPYIFAKEHLDILHVPYFNVPIFYLGKYIVTIHDLTILDFDTGKASTLPYVLYKIRRLGYRVVLYAGIKRASHIIAVSQAVKKDIVSRFAVSENKVSVTYEGVDKKFLQKKKVSQSKIPVEGNFFLYVGNVYPHKNIDMLLEAYVLYRNTVTNPAKLVLVGPADYFYRQLVTLLPSLGLETHVVVLHQVSDDLLSQLYGKSVALLFPSKMEGFGLPALEALVCGGRVICSDIPVFHEILGLNAVYVDTHTPNELVAAMKRIAQKSRSPQTRFVVESLLSKYSWKKMAEKTYQVYRNISQNT